MFNIPCHVGDTATSIAEYPLVFSSGGYNLIKINCNRIIIDSDNVKITLNLKKDPGSYKQKNT